MLDICLPYNSFSEWFANYGDNKVRVTVCILMLYGCCEVREDVNGAINVVGCIHEGTIN